MYPFSVIKGFIEASLITNKNLITDEPWNVECLFPLLSEVKKKLSFFSTEKSSAQMRRKMYCLDLFKFLLLSANHVNSFKEENRSLYNLWFKSESFFFENPEVEKDVLALFQKYWGPILDKDGNGQISFNTLSSVGKNLNIDKEIGCSELANSRKRQRKVKNNDVNKKRIRKSL